MSTYPEFTEFDCYDQQGEHAQPFETTGSLEEAENECVAQLITCGGFAFVVAKLPNGSNVLAWSGGTA